MTIKELTETLMRLTPEKLNLFLSAAQRTASAPPNTEHHTGSQPYLHPGSAFPVLQRLYSACRLSCAARTRCLRDSLPASQHPARRRSRAIPGVLRECRRLLHLAAGAGEEGRPPAHREDGSGA